jgi:Spy/CpxP family protein refolding chaperone
MQPMAPSAAVILKNPNPIQFRKPAKKHTPMNPKMKTAMWSLLLMAGLSAALPIARAEQGEGQRQERRAGGPGERLDILRERLGLSDAQVAQLKEIFAAEREKIAAKRKELGKDANRAEVRAAMREIREKSRAKIAAVLTPEQREKFAQMREKMKERAGRGGPGSEGDGEGKKHRGPGGEGEGEREDEDMPPLDGGI